MVRQRPPPRIALDQDGKVRLEPDLSWWNGRTCTFVGDAKYKRVEDRRVPNADLYQLLAYTIALDLPGGLLIYAHGEAEEVSASCQPCGQTVGSGRVGPVGNNR